MTPTTWRNWAGNQTSQPVKFTRPRTETELVGLVCEAARQQQNVKVVGAGHSFTAIARTDDVLISLDDYAEILEINPGARTVTVQAGIRIHELSRRLALHGLAMSNLGDIGEQSIAGAISTSTHGTGIGFQSIAASVSALTLVVGDGSVVRCSRDEEPELFHAARVGLGALGIISTVTIECVPAFNLHAVEKGRDIDEVLDDFGSLAHGADHFEFFWMPHSDVAFTKSNNRTQEPANQVEWKRVLDEELLSNGLFGALCRLGRARPSTIPAICRRVGDVWKTTGSEYIATSHSVFTTPRRVRFYEMEYAIPIENTVEAVRRVRQAANEADPPVSFPIEVRVLGSDDIPLSTATGRLSAYIAVHVFQGMDHTNYFNAVERIMQDYAGRPHWGKLHSQTAQTLPYLYPEWDRFIAVRNECDPSRRFGNEYLHRVLGS